MRSISRSTARLSAAGSAPHLVIGAYQGMTTSDVQSPYPSTGSPCRPSSCDKMLCVRRIWRHAPAVDDLESFLKRRGWSSRRPSRCLRKAAKTTGISRSKTLSWLSTQRIVFDVYSMSQTRELPPARGRGSNTKSPWRDCLRQLPNRVHEFTTVIRFAPAEALGLDSWRANRAALAACMRSRLRTGPCAFEAEDSTARTARLLDCSTARTPADPPLDPP